MATQYLTMTNNGRCPPAMIWVNGYNVNGRYVKGHCRRRKYGEPLIPEPPVNFQPIEPVEEVETEEPND